jgi:electron transfer flavoprotein beta subunit
MGLPAAVATLKDALYRGADEAVLVTDARCAASDTLATSYILSCAVKRIKYDIVLCGRQAIDGDTAQVGPQLAEKLGIPQITYVEKPVEIEGQTITAQRNIGNGWQKVKAQLPVLLTVTGEANVPRVAAAKKMMKYKAAMTPTAVEQKIKVENSHASADEAKELAVQKCGELDKKGLLIEQWNLDLLKADLTWCGRNGSPTKVHRIQSVVLASKETKSIEPTDEGLAGMIHELIDDKIIA